MQRVIRAEILGTERRASSRNGNPRFLVKTTDGDYLTITDAACAYGINNAENMAPNLVDITLERNQIVYVEPVRS